MKSNISPFGVTVQFADRPAPHILDMLKAHGFRWNPVDRQWHRRSVTGAADFLGALDRALNPDRPDGACWQCGKPGRFRQYGAATPVLCDHCAASQGGPVSAFVARAGL
ncbi:MAG: hypothetical protein FJY92_05825 [Candidatus Hydrogenedentes bacterium]|nr:hypothetical protein [Candidatus Hydrogenedentota bacterium]